MNNEVLDLEIYKIITAYVYRNNHIKQEDKEDMISELFISIKENWNYDENKSKLTTYVYNFCSFRHNNIKRDKDVIRLPRKRQKDEFIMTESLDFEIKEDDSTMNLADMIADKNANYSESDFKLSLEIFLNIAKIKLTANQFRTLEKIIELEDRKLVIQEMKYSKQNYNQLVKTITKKLKNEFDCLLN